MNMLICEADITIVNDQPTCSTGWQQQIATVPFDASLIDPLLVAELIGAGFLLFLTPWAAAWGFSMLVNSIRRL